jgi:hypothetical protein
MNGFPSSSADARTQTLPGNAREADNLEIPAYSDIR